MTLVQKALTILREAQTGKHGRALLVAQLFAYQTTIVPGEDSVEGVIAKNVDAFNAFIVELNESLYVDITLARNIYGCVVRARYQLITCMFDASLLEYAVTCEAQQAYLNADHIEELNQLTKSPTFPMLMKSLADECQPTVSGT